MRKFIAGCCCLIVGLEVLICVPIAVVVAYAYGAASAPSQLVLETRPDGVQVASGGYMPASPASASCGPLDSCHSMPAWQPMPNNPQPLAYAPSALPVPAYDPYTSAPAQPSVSPPPATIPRVELPATPLPLPLPGSSSPYPPPASVAPANAVASAPVAAVAPAAAPAAASGQVSDEAEPQPEPAAAEDQAPPQTVADADAKLSSEDLQQLVRDWQQLWTGASAMQHVAARVCCGEECKLGKPSAADPVETEKAAQDNAIESIDLTAQHLYVEANRCEERYEFEQADQLRKLARELRQKAMEMQQRQHAAENDRSIIEGVPPPTSPQPMY